MRTEMTLKEKYKDKKPIGAYCMCNFGGLEFYEGDDSDYVTAFNFGNGPYKFRRSNVHFTENGRAYVNRAGRVYLDEVMRA